MKSAFHYSRIILFSISIIISFNILGQGINHPCNKFDYLKDTTFSDNSFIKYQFKNDSLFLYWGYNNIEKLYKKYPCNIPPTNIPSMKWKNEKFICLSFGCGNPCWADIFLPLFDSTKEPRLVYYVFDSDLKNNQIVYENNSNLTIENLLTNKKIDIKFDSKCNQFFIGYCIDSIRLSNNSFYIKWVNIVDNKQKVEERFIKHLQLN